MRNRSLGLAAQLIWGTSIYLVVVFLISVLSTRGFIANIMLANAKEAITNLAAAKAGQLDRIFTALIIQGDNLTELYQSGHITASEVQQYISYMLQNNPQLVSLCTAPDPAALEAPRIYLLGNSGPMQRTLAGQDYQYQEWYQIPSLTGRKFWSDPWFDAAGSETTVVSYSQPIIKSGRFAGVLRLDVPMQALREIVQGIRVKKSGYAFLLSGSGTFLAHPADSLAMNYSVFDIARLRGQSQYRPIFQRLLKGGTVFTELARSQRWKRSWLYATPLASLNWILAINVDHAELFADQRKLLWISLLITTVAYLTIALVIWIRTRALSKPIRELAQAAGQIGRGDFSTALPPSPRISEVETLTASFTSMTSSLREYISNLRSVTEAKNRMEAEIEFASAVQRKLLPVDSTQEQASNVTVSGITEPAGAVGGDLCDYFPLGGDRFLFGVADVAGKGVAAAMTMVMVSTFIRTTSSQTDDPREILTRLNRYLCQNNPEAVFVTMILGVLNTHTGETSFSNAGHLPLFIVEPGRAVRMLSASHGTALGMFADSPLGGESFRLRPGASIVLVTDGITEAQDREARLFGLERLSLILASASASAPQALTDSVISALRIFTADEPLQDDRTILALSFHP